MGMQDRDWYREATKEKSAGARKRQWWSRLRSGRVPVDLLDNANPPKLWGADWHWSIKLLVWLCIAVLILIARKLIQ